jgi:Fe-S cluster assembly protein SufD
MIAAAEQSEAYRAAFERRQRALAESEPAWLRSLRAEAGERFFAAGFPTTRQEAWRHTSVAPIARAAFSEPAASPGGLAATLDRLGFGGAFKGREAVFVNGRYAPELSSFSVAGARLATLAEAAADGAALSESLAKLASDADSPFTSLNTAFFEDALVLRVASGSRIREPLHLLHVSTRGAAELPTLSHPRTLIFCGRDSEAHVVESYGGPKGELYFANAVTEIRLEDGAILDHVKLQRESPQAFHVASLAVSQARDSRFRNQSVCVGGALVRNDIDARLLGPGADCTLDGLFVADGEQLMDTHTRIDHATPHGTSRELYKGILDGRSRGVFHGRIVVRKDAQKTDAHQSNRNLLLSKDALVNSTPQLEIFADDVKCKHGSTTGQLDPLQLFYLQSRGLSAQAARSLLTYAFASDLVARIGVPVVRSSLERFLQERLPAAPKEAVA